MERKPLTARVAGRAISALVAVIAICAAGCGSQAPASTPAATKATAAGAASPNTPGGPAGAGGAAAAPAQREPGITEYAVPGGSRPHDVAPAPDGRVWYTAQAAEALGVLNPATGATQQVPLGSGSAPHGVIVGPDAAAWVTDGGLNAIVRVDAASLEVTRFPLPRPSNANLNTASFDGRGILWFTGQAGIYGRLDPRTGTVDVFDAPRGRGPYGMTTTPDGTVWFSSLAGSYIARIASDGGVSVVDVPTSGGGARRVWSDSRGGLWVTEWFAGKLAHYDPGANRWREWRLPGDNPEPYAVYVDADDVVWVSDFGSNALLRFDPRAEQFRAFALPRPRAQVRQLLGRPGEVWGAGSGTDSLIVLRTR